MYLILNMSQKSYAVKLPDIFDDMFPDSKAVEHFNRMRPLWDIDEHTQQLWDDVIESAQILDADGDEGVDVIKFAFDASAFLSCFKRNAPQLLALMFISPIIKMLQPPLWELSPGVPKDAVIVDWTDLIKECPNG